MRFLVTVLVIAACGGGEVVPRVQYNAGMDALAKGELDEATTKLIEARSQAGADKELRYRTAMALGHVAARQADGVEVAEPEKALGFLKQSAGWFQDAARIRKKEIEPRANLEKVQRRIDILSDQLNDQGGIEARLERLLNDQRTMRDQTRGMLRMLDAQGVSDPVAYRGDFGAMATKQRALVADLGTLIDLAGDERDLISQKDEGERSDQEKVRLVQLEAALGHLDRARGEMANARRELRRLSAKTALGDAGAALEALKRAKEQLLDPIAVLQLLAAEQLDLLRMTPNEATGTLAPIALIGQQGSLAERTAELSARLGSANPDLAPPDIDPKQKRILQAAQAAAPIIRGAEAHMRSATTALEARNMATARESQTKAAEALLEAAELFADIRGLIERTYQSSSQTVALLTPPEDGGPTAADLPAAKRGELLLESSNKTATRLTRLAGLLEDELAAVDKQLEQAKAQAKGQGGQLPEGADSERQRLVLARGYRDKADEAIVRLKAAIAKRSPEALAIAKEAHTQVEELRRLYYSIVEHLKELHARQSETHDRSATAESKDDAEKAPLLDPLADLQRNHVGVGESLAKALEAQADAAAQSQDPKAADQADRLGRAAAEVRKALLAMEDAAGSLERARDDSASMSVSIEPALEAQPRAIEHLAEAIRILQPPKQDEKDQQQQENQDQEDQEDQEQKDQDQEDQQQKKAGQDDQKADERLSQQEAERRLRAIREREDERRKKRQQLPQDPVEKDW